MGDSVCKAPGEAQSGFERQHINIARSTEGRQKDGFWPAPTSTLNQPGRRRQRVCLRWERPRREEEESLARPGQARGEDVPLYLQGQGWRRSWGGWVHQPGGRGERGSWSFFFLQLRRYRGQREGFAGGITSRRRSRTGLRDLCFQAGRERREGFFFAWRRA